MSDNALDHPVIIRLRDLMGNVHWAMHIAYQLLIAEDYDIENNGICNFNWEQGSIDTMLYWDDSPQGYNFWLKVSDVETEYASIDSLPWFIDGKVEMHDKGWHL